MSPAKFKIKPMGDRIVVQREEAKQMKGGILLPESAQKKPREGRVVAVGPGKVDDKGKVKKMNVNVGDTVLFSSYGGTDYKVDETEYLILSEDDVLAVKIEEGSSCQKC
jgi:chaperonin GroES